MSFGAERRKDLDLVQARAACKLAEIHQLLAPGLVAPFSLDELQRLAENRMADMSPTEREALRQKAIVACAEIQTLMAEMSRYVEDISDELNKVNRHGRVISAYAQAARTRAKPAWVR
jgi:hypothetical protein